MTTQIKLPAFFIIESILDSLTIKNVAPGFWKVYKTIGNGRIVEYSDEEIAEKVSELKAQGWEIRAGLEQEKV